MMIATLCVVDCLDFRTRFKLPDLWESRGDYLNREFSKKSVVNIDERVRLSFEATQASRKEVADMVAVVKTMPREISRPISVKGINYLHYLRKLKPRGSKSSTIGTIGCVVYNDEKFVEAAMSFKTEPSAQEVKAAKALLSSISF